MIRTMINCQITVDILIIKQRAWDQSTTKRISIPLLDSGTHSSMDQNHLTSPSLLPNLVASALSHSMRMNTF